MGSEGGSQIHRAVLRKKQGIGWVCARGKEEGGRKIGRLSTQGGGGGEGRLKVRGRITMNTRVQPRGKERVEKRLVMLFD